MIVYLLQKSSWPVNHFKIKSEQNIRPLKNLLIALIGCYIRSTLLRKNLFKNVSHGSLSTYLYAFHNNECHFLFILFISFVSQNRPFCYISSFRQYCVCIKKENKHICHFQDCMINYSYYIFEIKKAVLFCSQGLNNMC